jgi:hypothetical protein
MRSTAVRKSIATDNLPKWDYYDKLGHLAQACRRKTADKKKQVRDYYGQGGGRRGNKNGYNGGRVLCDKNNRKFKQDDYGKALTIKAAAKSVASTTTSKERKNLESRNSLVASPVGTIIIAKLNVTKGAWRRRFTYWQGNFNMLTLFKEPSIISFDVGRLRLYLDVYAFSEVFVVIKKGGDVPDEIYKFRVLVQLGLTAEE